MPDGRLATLDFDVLLRNEEQFLMAAEKAVADWCSDALERAQARRAQRGAAWRSVHAWRAWYPAQGVVGRANSGCRSLHEESGCMFEGLCVLR